MRKFETFCGAQGFIFSKSRLLDGRNQDFYTYAGGTGRLPAGSCALDEFVERAAPFFIRYGRSDHITSN